MMEAGATRLPYTPITTFDSFEDPTMHIETSSGMPGPNFEVFKPMNSAFYICTFWYLKTTFCTLFNYCGHLRFHDVFRSSKHSLKHRFLICQVLFFDSHIQDHCRGKSYQEQESQETPHDDFFVLSCHVGIPKMNSH